VRKCHNKENSTNCQNTERTPKLSNLNKKKRQRNTQQVKEQDKCPPNQTKEEEIGTKLITNTKKHKLKISFRRQWVAFLGA